jgi:hypothetical protein
VSNALKNDDLQSALQHAEKYPELQAECYFYKGELLRSQNTCESKYQALINYQEAVKADPTNPEFNSALVQS